MKRLERSAAGEWRPEQFRDLGSPLTGVDYEHATLTVTTTRGRSYAPPPPVAVPSCDGNQREPAGTTGNQRIGCGPAFLRVRRGRVTWSISWGMGDVMPARARELRAAYRDEIEPALRALWTEAAALRPDPKMALVRGEWCGHWGRCPAEVAEKAVALLARHFGPEVPPRTRKRPSGRSRPAGLRLVWSARRHVCHDRTEPDARDDATSDGASADERA